MKNHLIYMGLSLLTAWGCGSSDKGQTEERLPAATGFQTLIQEFPELSLPLHYSLKNPLRFSEKPLDSALVSAYLGHAGQSNAIIPVGRVTYRSLTGLLYYDESDPTNVPLWLALYDAEGKRISQVVFGGNTDEVAEHFGNILESSWEGATIRRKLEYHYGNDADNSYTAETLTRIGDDGKMEQTPAVITPPDTPDVAAHPFRLLEYALGNDLKLYVLYPYEDVMLYVLQTKSDYELCQTDDEASLGNTLVFRHPQLQQLQFGEPGNEQEGIIAFDSITVVFKDGKKVSATGKEKSNNSFSGGSFVLSDSKNEGALTVELRGESAYFQLNTRMRQQPFHICELDGKMFCKGNFAYYQGTPFLEKPCKLIFVRSNNRVQIFSPTSPQTCGCGEGVSVEHVFRAK